MTRYSILFLVAVGSINHMSQAVAQKNIRGVDLPLYYDFRTGNVTIDTTNVNGGVLTGYSFRILFDGYIPENFTPFMHTFFVDSAVAAKSCTTRGFLGGPPKRLRRLQALVRLRELTD